MSQPCFPAAMESYFAGGLGLLIGLLGLWTGLRKLRTLAQVSAWPTVPGCILERGSRPLAASPQDATDRQHAPLVRYAYKVGGKAFESDVIHPRRVQPPESHTREWALKKADAFPVELTVYYNPVDPAEAFLQPTPKGWLYAILAGSGIALLVGLAFLTG